MEIPSIIPLNLFAFKLDYILNRPVLFIVFCLFFLVYSVLTAVLVYHWNNYGMRSKGILFAESLFFLVSISLFVVAGLSIYYF